MAEKVKLAVIADAGAPTGFATVTHSICEYLQNTGEFDIHILAINYHGKPNEWSKKLNLYPAILGGDPLGIGYAKGFIEEIQPDVVWLFQDFWNIPYYIGQFGVRPGIVSYFPVDSPNIKGQYLVSMAASAAIGTYTHFGVQEAARAAKEAWENILNQAKSSNVNVLTTLTLELDAMMTGRQLAKGKLIVPASRIKELQNPDKFFRIPHGIHTGKFFPLDQGATRESFGLDKDFFIVGNVNRNQSRKRQDLMIKAFSAFAVDKPNARLVLHCVANDSQGWDLQQLAKYYGVEDKVLLTHMLFQNRIADVTQLNQLYNLLDVQVNCGGGEGWGLTSFEGAGCRVPQIVPDWSATKEIWQDAGLLTKVIEVRHEPNQINTAQAVIDVTHLTQQLDELYENPTLREEVGQKCYLVTRRPEYEWEAVGEQFSEVLKNAVGVLPPAVPTAINMAGQLELKKIKSGK